MSAKEKLKATYAQEEKKAAAQKIDPAMRAVVEKLKAKRSGMVSEVENAELELARMKSVVEEAEAVYSQARARVHAALSDVHHHEGEGHGEGEEDFGEHFHGDDTDWDKYLHFGEHETDDERDEDVAAAAEAAAEAHAAAKRGMKKPADKRPKSHHHQDGDATDHDDSDEEIDEDLVDSDEDELLDDEERAVMRANEVLAEAGLPPMHEIEHILLTELKKLEAANAAVVHARLALEAIDAEFSEAIANVHSSANSNAYGFNEGEDEGEDEEDDEDDHEDEDEDEDIDLEDHADEEDFDEDLDAPAPARKASGGSAKTNKSKSSSNAQNNSLEGGQGGRVVEDRRYGIYDARRYRSEAENDAEEAAKSGKGAKASTTSVGGKRKAATTTTASDAGKKAAKTTAGGKSKAAPAQQPWYDQRVDTKAPPKAQKRSTTSRAAAQAAPGTIPTWRKKRTATRVTIGRPVAGPTSWAAIGQHIIQE